jgi:hypothetical protein
MPKNIDITHGDLISFKASDGNYKVLLCTSTFKERIPQYFTFAALTYNSSIKPDLSNILSIEFLGIGDTRNDLFKYPEIQLEKMWHIHPEIKPSLLGSYGLIIWRKEFMKMSDHFEIIQNIKIVDNLDKNGNGSMNASDWNYLNQFFASDFISVLKNRGQKLFKLNSIIIDNE